MPKPGQRSITVSDETYDGLKIMSKGMPVPKFLRELVKNDQQAMRHFPTAEEMEVFVDKKLFRFRDEMQEFMHGYIRSYVDAKLEGK